MTNDDKAHQLGTLMIELESTEREASQYREKVKLFKDTLRAAADGDLRSALTEHNMSFLSVGTGHLASKIELPTTDELLAAVTRLEELEYRVKELKGRLRELGFAQPNR